MFKLQGAKFSNVVEALKGVMLVVNPLIWYSAVIIFLQNFLSQQVSNSILTPNEVTLIWTLHFSAIIISAFVGVFLTKKVDPNRFLVSWMILGVLSSVSLFVVSTNSMMILWVVVVLLGVSLGLGMPACMEYFTESLPIENRGKTSGLIVFLTGMGVFSATLDPIVHLNPGHHVDVYAIGGGGLFRLEQQFTQPGVATVTGFDPFFGFYNFGVPTTEILSSYSVNKPGIDAGLGFAIGTRWHGKLFAEARYDRIFMSNDRHEDYVPVSFGFRW